MNIRFYNARILTMADEADRMKITEGELHVCGNRIAYVGNGVSGACAGEKAGWDREIDACGNLLMPGFKMHIPIPA